MEEKKVENNAPDSQVKTKLSYEQLNDIAMQLSQQLETAKRQLSSLNMANLFHRLDYLFKVVELGDKFDGDFVKTCTEEIKSLMTVPEDTKEQ